MLSLVCGKVKELAEFEATSRSLRVVTQNFKVPQIALHSDKEWPVLFNPQDLVFFVLSHTKFSKWARARQGHQSEMNGQGDLPPLMALLKSALGGGLRSCVHHHCSL